MMIGKRALRIMGNDDAALRRSFWPVNPLCLFSFLDDRLDRKRETWARI